ncbi:MAG: response regulator [Deferribacteraceae bacterium]|jgi:CheY-like chemotaxis protein|nr:response regulator [Deferribacteraceae bacterium]
MARALVFEDNPINSKMLGTFLNQEGYMVDFALKFDELVNMHMSGYDIVMIDVHSPAVDAHVIADFVARTKAYSCPPLIAILNSNKEKEIKQYMDFGIDGYITRPVSVKAIRDMVERISSGQAIPTPSDDLIDLEKLGNALNMPDRNKLIALFDQFFDGAVAEIKSMYAAVKLKDYETLRKFATRFKATSRNLKLSNLGKLSEDIESQTKYPSANTD